MQKILIADDHPLFRKALREVLGSMDETFDIDEAGTLPEVVEKIDDELELILLDLAMPQAEGFSALVTIRDQVPSVPIVVVSATDDIQTIRRAMAYGAVGFISKTNLTSDIFAAIRTVLNGGKHWPNIELTAGQKRSGTAENQLASLTRSEARVLQLIAQGKANKMIAFELDIKESTVKSHISSLLRKLQVHSRTQAVLAYKELGFDKVL